MDYKRIFWTAVCLLVVCCLVCNCALPSQATGVELIVGTAISVAAVAAVGSMLVGLGVSPGSDQTVFDDLVNGAVDMFEQAGKVVGGMMSIWSLTNSSIKYAIEPEIIEMLRDWLFAEDRLVSDVRDYAIYGEYTFQNYRTVFSSIMLNNYPYHMIFKNGTSTIFLCSQNPFSFYSSSGLKMKTVQYWNSYAYNSETQAWNTAYFNVPVSSVTSFTPTELLWCNYDLYYNTTLRRSAQEAVEYSVSTALDVALGEVAPSADSLADGYADWAQNSITLPGSEAGDDDIPVFPLGLGPDYLGTISKPQPDIWDGTSEFTIPDAVTGITISSPDSVTTGGYITIQADVSGAGDYDMLCSCSVTGATSTATHISAMEFENLWALECGADEEAETLTITVASVADPAIAVTKSIAVVKSDTESGEVETGTYTGILDTISAAVGRVAEWCSVLVDTVVNIPYTIIEGIKGLFVPSDGYIEAKVNALTSEFGFVNSIAQTGNAFKTFFVDMGMKPPIIYIDFSAARGMFSPGGEYALGGKTVFLDLTWYAEYKPTVDALLSAFLWLWFCWRMLLSLPGILQGTSGMWGSGDSLAGFEPWAAPRRLDSGSSGRLLGTSEHHQRFDSERKRFWER